MPPATRANPNKDEDPVINLKINELKDLITSIVQKETNGLQTLINELKNEVQILRESNIELIGLLTNKNYQMNIDVSKNIKAPVPSDWKKTGSGSFSNAAKSRNTPQENIVDLRSSTSAVEPVRKKDINIIPKEDTIVNNNDNELQSSEKWTTVMKKKKSKKLNVIVGSNKENSTVKGVGKFCYLHVYRLAPSMKSDDIINYLKSVNISDVQCEQLNSRFPDIYSSFKVSAPAKYLEDLTKPETWPEGVCVNRFFRHLRKNQHVT